MGKIFAITSGKGGVGKSTVSAGLSLSLSSLGYKVLLVDMDEGLRCLDLMLSIDDQVVLDLSDILQGREISDAVYKVQENLYLVPAPQKLGMIDAFSLANFANEVKALYDVVIFDFPAGIDFSLYTSIPKDALFLTVAFPDAVTVRDAAIVSGLLAEKGCESRLIINRFDYKISKRKVYKNIDDIIDEAQLQLIGIVPQSSELQLLSLGQPLKKNGKPMKALIRISKRLMGQQILLPKINKI
ncbi:MAG: AAA family ATPase [Clostridia bacterium]|nr:AAA family ATPase [Clostridia bacterium]